MGQPWAGADTLRIRHHLLCKHHPDVATFASTLEEVCVSTVESGKMTKDLARSVHRSNNPPAESWLPSEEFLDLLAVNLRARMSK